MFIPPTLTPPNAVKLKSITDKLGLLSGISDESLDRVDAAIEAEFTRLNATVASLSQGQRDLAAAFGTDPRVVAAHIAKKNADEETLRSIPSEMVTFLRARHGNDVAAMAAGYRQIKAGQDIEKRNAEPAAAVQRLKGWR
jgi:hypothetical protein